MTQSELLEFLEVTARKAGDSAHLPGPLVSGWKGDHWLFDWSTTRDSQVDEVALIAEPQNGGEVSLDLVARVWDTHDRVVVWSRSYPGLPGLRSSNGKPEVIVGGRSVPFEPFHEFLSQLLHSAWDDVVAHSRHERANGDDPLAALQALAKENRTRRAAQ